MAPLVTTIEIARPPAEVFAVATDPNRFTEWQKDVVKTEILNARRFTTTRRMTGGERTLVQEITDNDPPGRWAAEAVEGPIRPRATITVEPSDGGSRVTFTLDFEAHGLGVTLLPLIRRQAEKTAPLSYAALKTLLENA